MRAWVVLVVLLAGCAEPGAPSGTPPPPDDETLQAPWWSVGESWTIEFAQSGQAPRTTTLVNFANNTFNDPQHFWLGSSDRQETLDHVFFDNNPFLGRIHWEILAPHEKGMHSAMYQWPLTEGSSWTSPILFGREDLLVEATRGAGDTFKVIGEARADGARFEYDYDPDIKWFRELEVVESSGATALRASVVDHQPSGAKGTFYFLRGRDYLDADGGSTGESEPFEVKEEGATSIAFLLDVRTTGPATIEFVAPNGQVAHRETLPLGGTADKIVEIPGRPAAGSWSLRYVGTVTGTILVRGIIEYKATL